MSRGLSGESFLVTGAYGCIGAWVCRQLVQEGVPVVAYDLGEDPYRLREVLTEAELDGVALVRGDVADLGGLERAAEAHGVTHVIHLAALLIPLVRADPPRGALVNVVGATNAFELAKRRSLQGLAYASSAAVYGPADGSRIEDARNPGTLYGVFKLTNEAVAKVYWAEDGVGSIGLRPYVVYGPGRDQGLTAGPTLAMAAAARGEAFHIAFGGRCQLQLARDTARVFVAAARSGHRGASAFNVGGPVSHLEEVVRAIEAAEPESAGRITFDDVQLPFPESLDSGSLADVVGGVGYTPLAEGVRETIEHYRAGA